MNGTSGLHPHPSLSIDDPFPDTRRKPPSHLPKPNHAPHRPAWSTHLSVEGCCDVNSDLPVLRSCSLQRSTQWYRCLNGTSKRFKYDKSPPPTPPTRSITRTSPRDPGPMSCDTDPSHTDQAVRDRAVRVTKHHQPEPSTSTRRFKHPVKLILEREGTPASKRVAKAITTRRSQGRSSKDTGTKYGRTQGQAVRESGPCASLGLHPDICRGCIRAWPRSTNLCNPWLEQIQAVSQSRSG